METVSEHVKQLRRSPFKFTPYQTEMADKIFELITNEEYKELGKLVNTIRFKDDYEFIHYAFYHKYEFGWLSWAQKNCSKDQCIKYGFYHYNF